MLGANRSFVKDITNTADWFGFEIGYDKTYFSINGSNKIYAAAQHNGNISMLRKSSGDDKLRQNAISPMIL